MTPSGSEPATFRFVAQRLNHCATAVPTHIHSAVQIFRTDFNLKLEDTLGRHLYFFFKISSIGIYAGYCAIVQFLKTAENSYFWNFCTNTSVSVVDRPALKQNFMANSVHFRHP